MMNFEQFEAASQKAVLLDVREGYITLADRTFFNPSLKSRKAVRAFIDQDFPLCLLAICFSQRGRRICSARETDLMGLTIRNPEYMGWDGWPYYGESLAAPEEP